MSQCKAMRKSQRGLALITVMLVLALAVVLATEIASRLNFSMRRAENWQLRQQGMWYAIGAEALVVQVLEQDMTDSPAKTHLDQFWAQPTPPFPVDEVLLKGQLSDLHACLNVNALAEAPPENADFDWQPAARKPLELLLSQVGVEDYEAEMLSYAMQDWIDVDQNMAGSLGAEDSHYASGSSPYLTPDTPLVWLSELRPVRGMSSRLMDELAPYLCVRPADNTLSVNINTVSQDNPEILYAVLDGLVDLETTKLLLESRPEQGYDSVDDFMKEPAIAALDEAVRNRLVNRLTVRSEWFMLSGQVESERGRFELSSLLQAKKSNGVSVVSRKYGGAW